MTRKEIHQRYHEERKRQQSANAAQTPIEKLERRVSALEERLSYFKLPSSLELAEEIDERKARWETEHQCRWEDRAELEEIEKKERELR